MIGRLTGILGDHNLDGSVILDVAGVGYEVHVPIGALGRLPEGSEVTLHVHTHVHLVTDARHVEDDAEIGRASCRERV